MFKIENKNIYLNRGDQVSIKLVSDKTFEVGDIIKFSVVKENNYGSVVFQKEYQVEEESNEFTLTLYSEDTKIGNLIRNNSVTYWYEIELNGIDTLIGYDSNGPKLFVLYPEAPEEGE